MAEVNIEVNSERNVGEITDIPIVLSDSIKSSTTEENNINEGVNEKELNTHEEDIANEVVNDDPVNEKNEACADGNYNEQFLQVDAKVCRSGSSTSLNDDKSVTNACIEDRECSLSSRTACDNSVPTRDTLEEDNLSNSFYSIKWIQFHNESIPIVTQNANGPCPLIALANVLLLRKSFRLEPGTEIVTGEKLAADISEHMMNLTPHNLSDGQMLNYQQNINDALQIFPKLQTGLDVNVRFTGASDFEFTDAQCIFDVLSIPLYHGWLVDPSEREVANIIDVLSYNQLVEKIICDKSSSDTDTLNNALLAEDFLKRTASQLTYHGLIEITQTLSNGQLAVLFRNNHFSTIYKKDNCLYVLVTDISLVNEPSIVWEVLNDVDGDTQFVNSEFNVSLLPDSQVNEPVNQASGSNQLLSDYELARTLQNTEDSQNDFDLARRLQEEEDQLQQQQQQQQQQQLHQMQASGGGSASASRNHNHSTPRSTANNSGSESRPSTRRAPTGNQGAGSNGSEQKSVSLFYPIIKFVLVLID